MLRQRVASRLCRLAVLCGLASCLAPSSHAGELFRAMQDLDGDGRAERIRFVSLTAKEPWRNRLVIEVGGARFETSYHAQDGDVPSFRFIAIDHHKPQRQLLIETVEPGSCVYHLLTYAKHKLVNLLSVDVGPACAEPHSLGNGLFSVETWAGFWMKSQHYQLNDDGNALQPVMTSSYSVGPRGVAGAAARAITLEGAGCPAQAVQPGGYLLVESFDASKDRYLLRDAGDGCGWVPAENINEIDTWVSGLPWAG